MAPSRDATSPPFFIVGVHRSGTTLLRYMLSSHSRLYVPPESDFIPRFFKSDPTGQLAAGRVAQMLDTVFQRYRFAGEWQGEPPSPEAFLATMPGRTPADFLHALYGAYAAQNGAQRWGDKTPIYASYVDLIHTIFPEGQVIHIIRDPFDAALSMLNKYEEDELHVDIFFAARNWVRRIRAAQAAGARLGPDHYCETRYEALVEDPETELQAICDFSGEAYEPSMLDHHRLASDRIPQDSHFFDTVRNPLTKQRIGLGRQKLSVRDRRLIQAVAGGLMDELGYQREDLGPLPIPERLRLGALALKYAALQSGRKLLELAGLMPPI